MRTATRNPWVLGAVSVPPLLDQVIRLLLVTQMPLVSERLFETVRFAELVFMITLLVTPAAIVTSFAGL